MSYFEIGALFFVLLAFLIFVAYMRRLLKSGKNNVPNPDANIEMLGKAVLDLYKKQETTDKALANLYPRIEELSRFVAELFNKIGEKPKKPVKSGGGKEA